MIKGFGIAGLVLAGFTAMAVANARHESEVCTGSANYALCQLELQAGKTDQQAVTTVTLVWAEDAAREG